MYAKPDNTCSILRIQRKCRPTQINAKHVSGKYEQVHQLNSSRTFPPIVSNACAGTKLKQWSVVVAAQVPV